MYCAFVSRGWMRSSAMQVAVCPRVAVGDHHVQKSVVQLEIVGKYIYIYMGSGSTECSK